jgi:cysteine desulfurase/selenocysteine lyase
MSSATATATIDRVTHVQPEAQPALFDADAIRAEFPILSTMAHGKPLIYLDNGATTQKPLAVIDAVERFYSARNANIHRGVYQLSQTATHLYEAARVTVAKFLNASDEKEIIFTRGTTEGINLVAAAWGRVNLSAGDEVIVSAMEHHSNIVPWQMACAAAGATLRVIPINDAGELRMDEFAKLLSPRTKMAAVTHLSNSLGTVNDVKAITKAARAVGSAVLIDGAQWVAHYPTDVRDIDCDFYVFSGHKLYGPTGIGVLYGKRAVLEAMPPWQGGGDMIESVTFEKTAYAGLPNKFEAGTPNIAGAVGLGAAVEYLLSVGLVAAHLHESDLLEYATEQMSMIHGLKIVGTAKNKGSLISFVLNDPPMSSYDIGVALDREGIAVRTGHHCCQPVMDRFGIPSTTRASFAMYNTRADIDALVVALRKLVAIEMMKRPVAVPAQAGGDLKFPKAMAASPGAAADDLTELFDFLPDWDARMQEVVGMGENLPFMPVELKTESTRVHGCQSTVHLFGVGRDGRLDFVATSDAALVRGLIGILQRVYSGQPAAEVVKFDIESFLRRIGLESHLSMGRRNGLDGMIRRIRELAARIAS